MRRLSASALLCPLLCLLLCPSDAQRVATPHEVQPGPRDVVHAVWPFGPSYSGKLGGGWPSFSSAGESGDTSSQCNKFDDAFTGYKTNGEYCQKSSDELDSKAHLLLYSGRLGIVVDAGGLKGADASLNIRKLFPRFGILSRMPENAAAGYAALPPNPNTEITLKTVCSGLAKTYVLGVTDDGFVKVGLVRHGHAVSQISLTELEFQDPATSKVIGPCAQFTSEKQPSSPNCNGTPGHPCADASFPKCEGFVQGKSWGKCWSTCDSASSPNLWAELSVWGDLISLEFAWDKAFQLDSGCAGEVTLKVGPASVTTALLSDAGGRASITLTPSSDGSELVSASVPTKPVTATSMSGTVFSRVTSSSRDLFVEVPTSTPRCGYNKACADVGLMNVDVTLTNPHLSEAQTVRLQFSRKFKILGANVPQNQPSAEITGFGLQLWDASTMQPSGLPIQISKNWHSGAPGFWAGFDGTWWTGSSLLRIPPNAKISLSLAINYEKYGGVPAWSHSQLSIVGYSDKWLWEEAALGTGGENICFDPLGSHTRAFITDVRPKLFDGKWKANVGGGDFVQFFDANGKLQYLKQLDPQIHSSGPCLSNASYSGVTLDDALQVEIKVSGARTNDFVRVFLKVFVKAVRDVSFSRLVLFQMGSETYNYLADYSKIWWGGGGSSGTATSMTPPCKGGTNRGGSKMYDDNLGSETPFRVDANGTAPWWFAFEGNKDTTTLTEKPDGTASDGFVAGDRGLVVREFNARLGGVERERPSFSVLCDKIELGTPKGVRALKKDDFVEMTLEFLVTPRSGEEYELARTNAQFSRTLEALVDTTTSKRIEAQAIGGGLFVTATRGSRVESHYPVRVAALGNVASDGQDAFVMFNVEGIALGYVPVVISGVQTPSLSDNQGLWLRSQDAQNFTRVWQGSSASSNDFWQVNFDRSSGTYEIVFNVEFVSATTTVAFGTPPDSWPPAPAPATAAVPASAPAPAPAPINSETSLNSSKESASSVLLVQGVVIPVVLSLLIF